MKPVIRTSLAETGEDLGSALSTALAVGLSRHIRRHLERVGTQRRDTAPPVADRAKTDTADLAGRGARPSVAPFGGRASGAATDSED